MFPELQGSKSALAIMRSLTAPGQLHKPVFCRSHTRRIRNAYRLSARSSRDMLLTQWRCGILLLVTQMSMGETRHETEEKMFSKGRWH